MALNTIKNSLKTLGIVSGGLLLGFPLIAQPASAQTEEELNPCPRIYYEAPFNTSTLVPQGCPPNVISEQLGLNQATAPAGTTLGELPGTDLTPQAINPADAPTTSPNAINPPGTAETLPVRPPLPEERSQAVASIMPMNGTVDVQLINNTNAVVTYEVIGDTQRRVLQGGEEVILRNISLPATITSVRQDNGLVRVASLESTEGMLAVSLDEDTNLDDNLGVLRIQEDGQIFLN
jgi:hypothetical protein